MLLFVNLRRAGRRARDSLDEVLLVATYKCLEHTLVERTLSLATCIVLLVVVLQALPVRVPFLAALVANLGDAG